MPADLGQLALKVCMFEAKFNSSSSLIMRRQTSNLSQSLVSEACKLAGLSAELAKKASVPGSNGAKVAALAHRLEMTDSLLSTYTSHYGDNVQQVLVHISINIFSVQFKIEFLKCAKLKSLPAIVTTFHTIALLKLSV